MLREAVVHALLAHLGTRQAVKALEALEGRTGHTQKGNQPIPVHPYPFVD